MSTRSVDTFIVETRRLFEAVHAINKMGRAAAYTSAPDLLPPLLNSPNGAIKAAAQRASQSLLTAWGGANGGGAA